MSQLMSTRYSDTGINTISHVEIFKGKLILKNSLKQIYHVRLDYNRECSAWTTLTFFAVRVLPLIHNPFVLIITGEDITIPNQVDPRWQKPCFKQLIRSFYTAIVTNPFLLHCFIENRDEIHAKTSSIPLGINPREMPQFHIDAVLPYLTQMPNITERKMKAICIHRTRPGDREVINTLKNTAWKDCVITTGTYAIHSWWNLLQTYPFIVCAHGGGIDPCPRIWEALCVGCIPIIKHSALDDIYVKFPVVFVDSWEKDTITFEKMREWRDTYSKYYENPELRKTWVPKLYLNYWKDLVYSYLPPG